MCGVDWVTDGLKRERPTEVSLKSWYVVSGANLGYVRLSLRYSVYQGMVLHSPLQAVCWSFASLHGHFISSIAAL
ncbi:hypothetical protein [Yersinia massiliensis]|uniref:hypothetical protein n=1 Tax=Yersinia massiliensis TaxID=419257 RepID=UPI001C941C29|nr:hypothetical protein [Yersinia massiliensis]